MTRENEVKGNHERSPRFGAVDVRDGLNTPAAQEGHNPVAPDLAGHHVVGYRRSPDAFVYQLQGLGKLALQRIMPQ